MRPGLVAALIVALVFSVSCASDAEVYGGCGGDGGESVEPAAFVSEVERWLEVGSITDEMHAYESDDTIQTGTTETIPVAVEAVEGSGGQDLESLTLHTSMIPGIVATLDRGGAVFLGLSSEGVEEELVFFALARPEDEGSYFTGRCSYRSLTEPLRERLGEDFEVALDSVIGITDDDRIVRALFPGSTD